MCPLNVNTDVRITGNTFAEFLNNAIKIYGLQYYINNTIELFGEVVPGISIFPSTEFDIGAGISARYYF